MLYIQDYEELLKYGDTLKNKKLKVIYLDAENSRMVVEFPTYSLYGNDRIEPKYIKHDWHFTCVSWAELNLQHQKVGKIECVSLLDDMKRFNKDHRDDYVIVKKLHEVLKDCDILIGHNLQSFDFPKLNYKFAKYGLSALDNPVIVDTLRAARKYFRSTSNSLYFLAKEFNVALKDDLPKGVMHKADEGDVKSLKRLISYNKQDIRAGSELYFKMLPFIKNHPDIRKIMGMVEKPSELNDLKVCATCGSSNVRKNGTRVTKTGRFQAYHCGDCGSSTRGPKE